jgi:uncharacterized protein UPF0236
MDRTALSKAIIAEMAAVVRAGLEETVPALLDADLATMEQRVQQLGRVIFGRLIEVVAVQRDQGAPQPLVCPDCGGALRRRTRPRHLQGVVGDYRLQRTYYWCAGCRQGQAPLDDTLGLGPGVLSPGLARVVARAAIEAPFAQAVDQVQEALGVTVSEEVLRRTTESLGAVAEAQTQAAIERAQQESGPGQAVWPQDALAAPEETTILAVEVDGVQVQHDDGWHEMKVVTVAPLGPHLQSDPDTGRGHLAWGAASYGAGTEGAEDFWWRVYVEARRRGLGTAAVRTVVVLGDGAEWIWQRARAFLAVAGTEVVEIVDIYHAYEYLWAVGTAVFGAGSPQAVAWVAPLKGRLYTQGAAPILAALALLRPTTPEAEEALHAALSYFTTQAARMDYPRFVARQFPIGSGAVESCCKCLVEARAKQAGMRWSTLGVQRLISLRALHRSGRWDAFWQTQPHRLRPRERTPHRPLPAAALPAVPPQPLPPPRPAATEPPRPRLLREGFSCGALC